MSYYQIVKDFRINLGARKKLGQGSEGAVYPGISLITKDPVAAKRTEGVYKEYFNKDAFEKEADLLLNRIAAHENIIKVLDFTKTEYEDKDIPKLDLWLITELCEFGNLKEFAIQKDLSIEQKIELMYQSALAVRHLHGCKPESIAHRDVKPENILLTGNENSPTVKLCDFGSAKSVTRNDGKSMAMWSLAGTRRYQAPEQVEAPEGHSKYDKQVDIFSLGITFLALLKAVKGSLMSPETINEKGLGEIMWIKHKNRQAFTFSIHKSSDSAVVTAVKDVIENMIRFEPSSRLSAAEVVEELSKLRKGHPAPQPIPGTDLHPITATDPKPAPATDPQPAPVTDPHRSPATDPQPSPATDPQPSPATDPQPSPATDPQPSPATDPQPSPATDPQPSPATDPQPSPATDPQPSPATDPQESPATDPQPASTTETWLPRTKVVALFSFEARFEDELSFEKYDVLTIIKSTSGPNWHQAEDQRGHIGWIPSSYVRRRREVRLQSVTWLHGKMTWRQARARLTGKEIPESMTLKEAGQLLSQRDVGTFLVHAVHDDDKMAFDHKYTLHVVRPDGKVECYSIFITKDRKFTIDEHLVFDDLQQLVQVYGQDANDLCTSLLKPLVNECGLRLYSGDFWREGWTISQSDINILDNCYAGQFSDTHTGVYLGRDVFIRKRKDPHSVQDVLIEAAVMTGLSHKNLVQLIGVVLGDEVLIVTEFLSKGRLYDYLCSQGPDGITSQDQISFARDVCNGMLYLEQKSIVHRIIWARSVLLSQEGTAKVGDFCSAHPVDHLTSIQQFPVKWTAPESFTWEISTGKSDVWSFGVLLWEIYSYGQHPYHGISNKNIYTHIMDGGRLEAPDGCPDEIYHVMLATWDIDPAKRPSFSDVCRIFDTLDVHMYELYLGFVREGWTINCSDIHIRNECYTDTLTKTYKGEYLGRNVLIRKGKHPYSVQDARIEAAVMAVHSHKNVVQLIGVVLGDETLIVTEFLSKGRLYDYLRSQGPDAITSQDQMSFARDVCHGMQYLEQKGIVHRNLSARSVLLSVEGTAKVGDFISACTGDGHRRIRKAKIRWTAPEVRKGKRYTSKSDVWSFGVLLWEIYSYGQQPYAGIPNEDIPTHLMDGGRLEAPDGCPYEIYHVMLAAWEIDPAKRPTFYDLCKILDKVEVDMYMTCLDSLEEYWNISQSEVHVLDKWYTGFLTDTYKGEYSGRDVSITQRQDPHCVQDARIEAAVMTGLSHKNLVQLIGVVLRDETLIVTEFLSKGRLYDYLRSQGPDGITRQDQMSFARDVCHGMQYLERRDIVHRNLYAQSVLISEDGTAKVGGFTLAHPVYRRKLLKKFPIRWSAPEVTREEEVTSKSDVWSFGVLLWEIYSFGLEPYDGIPNDDIYSHVEEGGRLKAPNGCPDEIYHVMLATWDMDPAKRPTFSNVCEILEA